MQLAFSAWFLRKGSYEIELLNTNSIWLPWSLRSNFDQRLHVIN